MSKSPKKKNHRTSSTHILSKSDDTVKCISCRPNYTFDHDGRYVKPTSTSMTTILLNIDSEARGELIFTITWIGPSTHAVSSTC